MREPIAREIIFAIGDNMREGLEPLLTKTLAPSLYQVYLHADDFERIRTILPQIEEEAKEHLNRQLTELQSGTGPVLKRLRDRLRKQVRGLANGSKRRRGSEQPMIYVPAAGDWSIRFQEDPNEQLEAGEIEVISEMAVPEAPSYGSGSQTQRISVSTTRKLGQSRSERATEKSASTSEDPAPDHALPMRPSSTAGAYLAYQDQDGPKRFDITRDEIVIGRKTAQAVADLEIRARSDVSRRHARIRRRSQTGGFWIEDLSQFGTEVNGRALPPGVEVELPDAASISLASVMTLEFKRGAG